MRVDIPLSPSQRRALSASRQTREMLVAAEPQSGGSHFLRQLALLLAARGRSCITLASPSERHLRETHLEGPNGLWSALDKLPTGAVRWIDDGAARFSNGALLRPASWQQAERSGADTLLIDDADEMPLEQFLRLRERVMARRAAANLLRIVAVTKRPTDSWTREHWRSLGENGVRVDLVGAELPSWMRGTAKTRVRRSFGDWIDRALPSFPWYPHTTLVVETIQDLLVGKIQPRRLLIQAPPRYFKSLIVSRLLPAHYLDEYPHHWAADVSATQTLAQVMSSDAREFYRAMQGAFRADAQDKSLWRTNRGGGMWARGVGGWALGLGFNLGIIDDPFSSWEEAMKPNVQQAVEDYFWKTFMTRREITGDQRAAVIVMHQRLADGDLAGRLLKREAEGKHPSEGWTVLSLAAIKRKRRTPFPASIKLIEDKRANGDVLCAALQDQDLASLERLEAIDAMHFAAVYQQDPYPDQGGGLFEHWWWSYAAEASKVAELRHKHPELTDLITALVAAGLMPQMVREARAWDIAGSFTGDLMASTRGGITVDRRVIFTDCQEMQVHAANVEELIYQTALRDGRGVEVILPAEPAAAGKILTTTFAQRLEHAGFRVVIVPTSASKYVRAMPHAGAASPSASGRLGRCHILPGEWNGLFTRRHHQFDGVTKPLDVVDSAAYLFSELDLSGFITSGIR